MKAEPADAPVTTSSSGEIVPTGENLPQTLVMLPLNNHPIMPGITVPLSFEGGGFIKLLQDAMETSEKMVGAALIRNAHPDNQMLSEMHPIGTSLKLMRVVVSDDGESVQALARALHRIECRQVVTQAPVQRWDVRYHRDIPAKPTEEIKAFSLAIISQVKELIGLSPLFQEQLKMLMSHLDYENPGLIMDLITAMTTAEALRVQDILATFDIIERAKKVLQLLREEIDLQRLQQQIKSQIDEKVSAHQKEFFLREQLKIIKKELGIEKDEKSTDIEEFRTKLEEMILPEEVHKVADEELKKLSMLEPASSEYPMIRTYLSWLVDLPWDKSTQDNLDLKNAQAVLDASHFGLEDVKDRILEFLATVQKRGSLTGSILCLVGPPGVGKTSVGRSIADALGRKFYRFSVGGMRDEAEIKGHRRTYIGAMPGKLIQALRRVESSNPVILIDEIDKLTSSYQGDPAAALLEVLDPEQNKDFLDHYLDVRFDLSKVLFLTTANTLDSIPAPLLDRMEVIKLSGYVLEEKLEIARRYLVPTQLKEHGLVPRDLKMNDKVLAQLIDQYAREAGVRNLENQIKKLCRKVARRQVEGDTAPVRLDGDSLQEFLGLPPFSGEELYDSGVPGVALGLAWTSMGGVTLYMEATALQNAAGGFKTTGRLGETMAESAQIAYSVARKVLCEQDPKATDFFQQHLVHLHVPEGATPKDGPSAGITMTLALYSLATGKAVKSRLAMTGEVTLTGKVLPIGGVREKVIAARRLRVMELILPKDNERDFNKLPDYIRKGVTVHFASWFGDVLLAAFPGGIPQNVVPFSKAQEAPSASPVQPVALPVPVSQKRRGRPPKEKSPEEIPAIPKKRGRPPKVKEIPIIDIPPRKRGRPPKPKAESETPKVPKKRGRPPKVKEIPIIDIPPLKRGRPPKPKAESETSKIPKKRGRPRKVEPVLS
ncbi:MAG TPA: endopeptidase La [Fibrobacteraceae bacterium]|nr:endopeptidase La [Fibrobacteraceae bacterium]